jgi:hypothetical protein
MGWVPRKCKSLSTSNKAVRLLGRVGPTTSCRNLFKELNILTLPCLYINEVICRAKINDELMNHNEEIHGHNARHKADFHTLYCRTIQLKDNNVNMGKTLFNKLPNTIKKIGKLIEFKRRLQTFLMQNFFIP